MLGECCGGLIAERWEAAVLPRVSVPTYPRLCDGEVVAVLLSDGRVCSCQDRLRYAAATYKPRTSVLSSHFPGSCRCLIFRDVSGVFHLSLL